MTLATTVRAERFCFADLREVFTKANEEKAGDQLAGLAAGSERERVAAKRVLAELTLGEIVDTPLIDPDDDEISRLGLETLDEAAFAGIRGMTVGEFREFLLEDAVDEAELRRLHRAITPEVAAAVTKLMGNKDLVLAASKVRTVTRCRNTMGGRGVLVNSVVGFIGPEYLADERQIVRAGLEDHFMGKLLGLPMGVDVCYTNHADADQNSADNLLLLLTAAGCNYVIGIPCAGDVMLNHQSVSYHDAAGVRSLFGLRPAPEFLDWLRERGIFGDRALAAPDGPIRRQLLQGVGAMLT